MRRAGPGGPPHTAAPLFHAQQHHAVRRHFIPELVLLVTAVVVRPKVPHAMLAAQPEILPAHGHLGGLRSAVVQPDGPPAPPLVLRRSAPASSGAASRDQRLRCARYSVAVMPPLPTSSMSGSFQWPGPAYFSSPFCLNPMDSMLFHLSSMSSVVRHRLPPDRAPHSQTLSMPYWQRL